MQHTKTTAGSLWESLGDDTLVQFATDFLSHNVKLLSIFVHIIEERDPEIRDKVCHLCMYIVHSLL